MDISIFVIGDDWKGKFDFLPCEVIYLKRTKEISSTKIKNIL
jgi:glycerol-3-phosphate cytidylyltransferase